MKYLYHVSTEKKAKKYRETGYIKKPVRGFDTLMGAMLWAIKTGRKVIYKINLADYNDIYKLPDHHNSKGTAWFVDGDVQISDIKCVVSGDRMKGDNNED